jgi:hypothetical protein
VRQRSIPDDLIFWLLFHQGKSDKATAAIAGQAKNAKAIKAIAGKRVKNKKAIRYYRMAFYMFQIFRYSYTLISTSTPLGNSSFISASTVFEFEL